MKQKPFIIILVFEVLVDMIAMGLLLSDLGAYCYLVAAVLFTIVLTPFFLVMKATQDEAKKAKIRRNILLVMLIPAAIATLTVMAVVIALIVGI